MLLSDCECGNNVINPEEGLLGRMIVEIAEDRIEVVQSETKIVDTGGGGMGGSEKMKRR